MINLISMEVCEFRSRQHVQYSACVVLDNFSFQEFRSPNQGLSQDLEAVPKVGNCLTFGASKFLRETTINSDFNQKHVLIYKK